MGREQEPKDKLSQTPEPEGELHLGRWLVERLAGLGEIELPPRDENRPNPFDGWSEEDFADEATIARRLAALGAPRRQTGETMDGRSATRAKQVVVNGEPREVEAATLVEALAALGYSDAVVATALNGEFVPARQRETTLVREGDRIEILAPRQGG
jgi:sulfur carrier protein